MDATDATASTGSPGSDDQAGNPLAGAEVRDGQVILAGGPEASDDESQARVESAVRRLYDADRFTRHLAGVAGWLGRQYDLAAPQRADPSDADFAAAAEVLHRRLMDGPLGAYLDSLSNQALEDALIVAAGFGPLVKDTLAEVAEKRRARRAGSDRNEQEGQGDD